MRVLFVSYGGGHVAMLEPLLAKARAARHEVIFLALTTAQHYLHQRGIAYRTARDLLPFAAPDAVRYGEELAASLAGSTAVPHKESVAYLGINFADLVAARGEQHARDAYAMQGRQAFLPLDTLVRAFTAWQPDLVIATNAPRMEQAAINAAGILGIKSICAVDLFALHEIEWIKQPGFATRICVINEAVRQMIIDHGRQSEEVVVTGNPAFDRLFDPEIIKAGSAMRATRGWNDGRITLLYGAQDEPAKHTFFEGAVGDTQLPATIETTLRTLVARDDRFRLVIRYHPNQKCQFIPGERIEFSPVSEPVPVLLHAVDVVVTMTSTIGLEAHIAGRPLVTVDCSIFTADAPYSRMGISTGVASPNGLPATLTQLADSWPQAISGSQHYSTTSAASEIWRVAETLLAR